MLNKICAVIILIFLFIPIQYAKACDYIDSGVYWVNTIVDLQQEYRDLLDDHNNAIDENDPDKRCRVLREIVELMDEQVGEAVEQCQRRWNEAINRCSGYDLNK